MTSPLAPLAAFRQWIVVKLVPLPSGKIDKLPVDYRTGRVTAKDDGGAHNPAIWLDYSTAALAALQIGASRHTVGFVLTANDPFFCVDIDSARLPSGAWAQSAVALRGMLPNTVAEVSVSGTGLHLWGHGAVPPHSAGNERLGEEQGVITSAALYTDKRFIVIGQHATGDMTHPCTAIAQVAANLFKPRALAGPVAEEGPCPEWRGPTEDDELLRRALQSRSAGSVFGVKATFADLWDANVAVLAQAYPSSNGTDAFDRSAADAALAQHLAFWTGKDIARIERLMRRSRLAREKWDDRDDYLVERTIRGACGMAREVLQDKRPEPPPTPAAPAQLTAQSVQIEGSTWLSPVEQVEYFKGCVYVTGQHRVLVPGGNLLKPEQFNAQFGGRIFHLDTRNEKTTRKAFEALTESQAIKHPRADAVCFMPQLPYGSLVQEPGRVRVNSYWPVEIRRAKGDPSPFLRHLGLLLPIDWPVLAAYMAALVQRQGIKFPWAPVIQGVPGNGKTLLSHCVAEAVGRRYVHWPKASKLGKDFNGWMPGKVLYCVEDIYVRKGVDVIEDLKPMITGGQGLEIESKGVDQTSEDIVGNFIFNTNHKDGIRKTRDDRRFCWLACAQQRVEDLARDGMLGNYFPNLWAWLKGDGFAIVTDWLMSYSIPPELDPAGACNRAPTTSSTEDAIANGRSYVEQTVLQAAQDERTGFAGGWISSHFLARLLDEIRKAQDVPPKARQAMLEGLGYVKHPGLANGQVSHAVMPDGVKAQLYVRTDHPSLQMTSPSDIARAYSRAQGVGV